MLARQTAARVGVIDDPSAGSAANDLHDVTLPHGNQANARRRLAMKILRPIPGEVELRADAPKHLQGDAAAAVGERAAGGPASKDPTGLS
jgi:hypothetical protein